MKAANALKEIFSGWEKRGITAAICTECGEQFDNYDLYGNGEFKASIDDDTCSACRKKKEDAEMVKRIIEKREERKYIKFENFSILPAELKRAEFNNYKPKNETQSDALETIKLFAEGSHEKTTMFFQGDTGIGKTHLSMGAYKEFRNRGKSTLFIDLPSLLASIRGTYSGDSDMTQDKIMNLIRDCELPVLDDIGAEYVKQDASVFESWAAHIIFPVANARQGKKNIYTTNFTAKYLNQKYGMMSKRILSRLMNNATVIKMEGQDHRLKGLD